MIVLAWIVTIVFLFFCIAANWEGFKMFLIFISSIGIIGSVIWAFYYLADYYFVMGSS